MSAIYLVRHGEVENPLDLIYGRLPGFGLSERGRAQVARTGQHLAEQLDGVPRIVSSPLLRAQQSARILMDELQLETLPTDERLIEADSGLEGMPRGLKIGRMVRGLVDRDRRRKAERPSAVVRRMAAGVREHWAEDEGRDLIVVAHQFPIMMARVALERGVTGSGGPRLVRAAPWLFMRGRCGLASVSTMRFERGGLASCSYWHPAD